MAGKTGLFGMGAAGTAAVAVAGTLALLFVGRELYQRGQEAAVAVEKPVAAAPEPELEAETVAAAAPEPEAVPEPEAAPETERVAEPEVPPLAAPSFDVVRIEPDGSGVIAGAGEVGSRVTLFLDDAELEQADVDGSGKFAVFVFLDPSDRPRLLTLRAALEGQEVWSEDQIILAPTPVVQPEEEVAEAAPTPSEEEQVATQIVPEPTEEVGSEEVPQPEEALAIARDIPVAAEAAPEEDIPEAEPVGEPTRQDMAEVAEDVAAPEAEEIAAAEVSEAAPEIVAEAIPLPEADPAPEPITEATAQVEETAPPVPEASPEAMASAPDQVQVADPQPAPRAPVAETPAPQVAAAPEPSPQSDALADVPGADGQTAPRPEKAVSPAVPDAPQAPNAPAEEPRDFAAAPATPAAPGSVAVLRAGADGVELLQPGTPQKPDALDRLALDTISYSEAGEVLLAGRAPEGTAVRVYLDNRAVADLPIGPDGRWKGEVPDVRPGVYTLRLDQVAGDGSVGGRIETPFKREAPSVLRAARADLPPDAPSITAVTVQKGDTLWAISRERYGTGYLYVRVFEANRETIRNPDLIYPGQVFAIPN